MRKELISLIAAFGIVIAGSSAPLAADKACAGNDPVCIEFANLAAAEQYDRIIDSVSATTTYSDEAKSYIGQAYLAIAGRETNTPAQEEQFCLKALEYGATSAYMGFGFGRTAQSCPF